MKARDEKLKDITYPERLEEPLVLSARVPLLEQLLDLLLRVLPLGHLLERLRANNTLEALKLKCVTGGEQVRVVDDLDTANRSVSRVHTFGHGAEYNNGFRTRTDLDEGLDLGPPRDLLRTHALGDLQWVALDARNDGVGVGALLGALIELLDHDDLLACLAAGQHDGNLEPTHNSFSPPCLPPPEQTRIITPFRACILRA